MKMNRKLITFFALIIIIASCTYEIGDYQPKKLEKFINIQARLSDLDEPQIIKLFVSAAGLTNNFVSEPVLKANVYIKDSDGKIVKYIEDVKDFGVYKAPNGFKGIAGKSYQLFFETQDGKKYESSPQKIATSPEITQGYSEANIKENLSINDQFRGGYDVFIDFKDPADKQFYRWSWAHYKRINVCAVCNTSWDFVLNECRKPGRFQTNNGVPSLYYCKGKCWDIERSNNINILNDNFINGKDAKKIFIKRIPYVSDANSEPGASHYLQVFQQTISEDAYKYYQALQAQESQGTLYDIPALTLFSINMKCTSNPEEKILGIFDAYSVKSKVVIAETSVVIPGATKQFKSIKAIDPCTVLPCPIPCAETETRTSKKPIGWVEKAFD